MSTNQCGAEFDGTTAMDPRNFPFTATNEENKKMAREHKKVLLLTDTSELDTEKMRLVLSPATYPEIMLDYAKIHENKITAEFQIDPEIDPFFNAMDILESMHQSCSLLSAKLFFDSTFKLPDMMHLKDITNLRVHNEEELQSGTLIISANFLKKEADSRKSYQRWLYFFGVYANHNGKIVADGTFSIAAIAPRELPDLVMPSLDQDKKEESWKTLCDANAGAIKKACEAGPRPGDLGCE